MPLRAASYLAVVALCVATTASGAQSVLGAYAVQGAQGAPVTLTLEADGPGKLKGTLSGNGLTFIVQGQWQGLQAAGTMRGSTGGAWFEARRAESQLQLTLVEPGPDGRPDPATARILIMTLAPVSPPSAPPAASAALQAGSDPSGSGSSPQDQQLSRLLLSSAWCSFSFAGGQTYTGGSAGRTSSGRAVFSADGTMQLTTGSETTSSGWPGSTYGNSGGAQVMRWRVQTAILYLSSNDAQWQPVRLEVAQNSSGYPIIKADGTEYMQCR